jgi:hypothetical protein
LVNLIKDTDLHETMKMLKNNSDKKVAQENTHSLALDQALKL